MTVSVGYRIKFWRRIRDCSQQELAVAAGYTQAYINYLEKDGRRSPLPPKTLAKMAKRLGIPVEYLKEDGPEPLNMLHTKNDADKETTHV